MILTLSNQFNRVLERNFSLALAMRLMWPPDILLFAESMSLAESMANHQRETRQGLHDGVYAESECLPEHVQEHLRQETKC
jgi:hypothetical protein